jgi:ABC-type transport system involved in multi-copper enzyme maturation permease subunit
MAQQELTWISGLKRTYLSNATATRDMRVQLRGSRAAVLFTIYLFLMTVILLWIYDLSLGSGGMKSLATAQGNLQGFYYATLGTLAAVITLVAPSMGAFAIVSEKQRRSLDLVFSAPTEPKYYLVGKLISSYRFVWLLLVLSLPFCAVSVTLGGTTWVQLFITFLMYSFYGLVCVSFGLLMSTLCNKVLPALIWTYAALACYLIVTGYMMAMAIIPGRSSFDNLNPAFSLFPACYSFIADQTWPLFGREIPTWLLSIGIHLLVVKFIILASGSMIAPGNSKEIKSLRLHSLIYCSVIFYLISSSIGPFISKVGSFSTMGVSKTFSPSDVFQVIHGRVLFGLLFALGIIIVPYLASFGFNDLRRHRPDGLFNLRQILTGRPSGHLPFLLLLFFLSSICYALGGIGSSSPGAFISFPSSGSTIGFSNLNPSSLNFLMSPLLALSIWLVAFFLGWLSSSKTPILSKSLFFFILGLILPTAIFSILAMEDRQNASGIWLINPLIGIVTDIEFSRITGIHAAILTCIAILLLVIAIPKVAKQAAKRFDNPAEVTP